MLLPTVIFSGGHKCDVFMISTIAYRPATCKQGIMISVSRPGSIAAICVWFGSTPRSGSAEITGVLWPQKCVFSSIHPSVLFTSSVTQADAFQCVAGGWSASSWLTFVIARWKKHQGRAVPAGHKTSNSENNVPRWQRLQGFNCDG